jgi:hypothetical protein
MRKSTRLLGICVLYSFAVSVCLIVTLRLLYVYKPYGAEEEGSSGSREEARSDSIRAMGPGNTMPWYRITLGLQKAGPWNANDRLSIFRDIPLHYLSHGHGHIINVYWKGRWGYRRSRGVSFQFGVDTPNPDQRMDWKRQIRVVILQQCDANNSDVLYNFNKKRHPSHDGITRYWIYESATAEWAGRGWVTQIQVPLAACNGDSIKARALAERIGDRMLKYYATLN